MATRTASPGTREIEGRDSVGLYLDEIARNPLLDAATEVELWSTLRERGATVVGATSKRAALVQADRVVVLVEGRVAATGPWSELAPAWGHLAG